MSPRRRKLIVNKLAEEYSPDTVKPPAKKQRIDLAITENTVRNVINYFTKDSISVQAPGTKDFKIVRKDRMKEKLQKRYMTMTLREVYEEFKIEYPMDKIGFSKFCEYRPEHVCLREETPANVCLCIYHENVRLLLEAIPNLPNSTQELCKLLVCEEEAEKCMMQASCDECKNLQKFDDLLQNLDEEELNTQIKYKQWVKSEDDKLMRVSLEDNQENVLSILHKKLGKFLRHVYIKRVQAKYFEELKIDLPPGTVLIQCDFSENYTHKRQNEIQSVYWDTDSSTLYTCMVYFRISNAAAEGAEAEIKSMPYVVISDYKRHDKYATVIFNRAILEHFQNTFTDVPIEALIYQSDGAAQHFKQKFTLCQLTFNSIPTTWNFSATSHGKGCIDGIGGSLKRCVIEYVLAQNVDLNSAEEFAQTAKDVCPNITVLYIPHDKLKADIKALDVQWHPGGVEILSIPGTRDAHFFKACEPYKIKYATTATQDEVKYSYFSFKDGVMRKNTFERADLTSSISNKSVRVLQDSVLTIGSWVEVKFYAVNYVGQIKEAKDDQFKIRCLLLTKGGKAYKFEPEKRAVWYKKNDILGLMTRDPTPINSRGLYKL